MDNVKNDTYYIKKMLKDIKFIIWNFALYTENAYI